MCYSYRIARSPQVHQSGVFTPDARGVIESTCRSSET